MLDFLEYLRRIFALAHQHHAGDHVVVVVLADGALALDIADHDARDVAHQHRGRVAFGQNDIFDVGRFAQQTYAANGVLLTALFDIATAGIAVAAFKRGKYLLQGELVGAQARQVRLHFVSLYEAAHRHDVGDTRHAPQGALDHPILKRAQGARVVGIRLDAVAVDLADGRRQRGNFGFDAGRQLHGAQALANLLARPIHVGVVVEGEYQKGQSELGMRKHPHRVWQA